MKLVISLISIIVTATLAFDEEKLTLEQWYNKVQARHPKGAKGDPFQSQLTYLYNNKRCIDDAINFNGNKQVELYSTEANILIYGAAVNCLGSNKDSTLKQVILHLSDYYRANEAGNADCYMKELEKYPPKSELLNNFNSASINAATCAEVVDIDGISESLHRSKIVVDYLSDFTCNFVNRNIWNKYAVTIVALLSNKVAANRATLAGKIGKDAGKILDDAYKCVKDRVIRNAPTTTAAPATTTKKAAGNQEVARMTDEQIFRNGKFYNVFVYNGRKMYYANQKWNYIN